MKTDPLQKQHAELNDLIRELFQYFDQPDKLPENKYKCRMCLTHLHQRLQLHLAMEDNIYYPKMCKSLNSELAQKALEIQAQNARVKEQFDYFVHTWTSHHISLHPHEFITQAKSICEKLQTRMEQENIELYAFGEGF